MNIDLRKLVTWLQSNELSLNVEKINSMRISTKQRDNFLKSANETLELKIRDNELEVFQSAGTQIDRYLDRKEQIKAFFIKVSMTISLRYCCSLWGYAVSRGTNQFHKL